MTDAITKIK